MPMQLGGFDVVIIMDWLASKQGEIICNKRIIRIYSHKGEPITIYGGQSERSTRTISIIKAQKCFSKGCLAYLAYVIDTKSTPRKIEDVPVVWEYPNVFPEDLPGVPPER
jgi:hypothetical protein